MKIRFLLIFLVIILAIYMNFINKHEIMKFSEQTESALKILQSRQEVNQDLLSVNSKLLARDRIKKLASEELNMIFAESTPLNIGRDDNNRYKLIDFFVPTAEALNR